MAYYWYRVSAWLYCYLCWWTMPSGYGWKLRRCLFCRLLDRIQYHAFNFYLGHNDTKED